MIDIIIKQYNRKLLIYLSLLGIIGTIMLYSASWYESFLSTNGYTEMFFLKNHLKRLLIGLFFLIGFLLFDYRTLKGHSHISCSVFNIVTHTNKMYLFN